MLIETKAPRGGDIRTAIAKFTLEAETTQEQRDLVGFALFLECFSVKDILAFRQTLRLIAFPRRGTEEAEVTIQEIADSLLVQYTREQLCGE